MTWSSDAESGEPPRLLLGAIVLAASLTLGLTLFFGVVLLPAVAVLAAAVSELVLFGALLLASSLIRIAAGLFAARMYRRRRGTDTRIEALPSVLTGVVIAWAVYFLLVATSASATGTDLGLGRLLLELPRWLVEGAIGAAFVAPGQPEQLDPRLRRFATLDRRHR